MRTLLIAIACIAAAGCRSTADPPSTAPDPLPAIEVQADTELTRQEILRFIPVGTPIDEAQRIMEHNQFECTLEPGVRLYCDRQQSKSFWVAERWQVTLPCEDGKVAGIRVSYGLIGP